MYNFVVIKKLIIFPTHVTEKNKFEKIQYVLAGFTWLWSWKMCHFYPAEEVAQPGKRYGSQAAQPNAFVSLVRYQI